MCVCVCVCVYECGGDSHIDSLSTPETLYVNPKTEV